MTESTNKQQEIQHSEEATRDHLYDLLSSNGYEPPEINRRLTGIQLILLNKACNHFDGID